MNVSSKSGHIISCFHKRRKRFAFTVEKYDFDSPGYKQIDNTLEAVVKDCKDKHFKTFEYRYQYDIKFELKTSGEVFYFKKTNVFKLFSS